MSSVSVVDGTKSFTTAQLFVNPHLAAQGDPLSLDARIKRDRKSGRIHPFLSDEQRHARMRENMARNIPSFAELRNRFEGAVVCVCGSGPSLANKIHELAELHRAGAIVMAANTAHDWLWDRSELDGPGPRVHFGVLCDSNDWVSGYMTPRAETEYLLASQCHAKTFERFEGARTYLWHSIDTGDEDVIRERTGTEPYVDYGVKIGSSVGLRQAQLAIGLGGAELHLFGFDSSAKVDNVEHPNSAELHATGKPLDLVDNRYTGNEYICALRGRTLKWWTNDAMATQAVDFEHAIYDIGEAVALGKIHDVRLLVHGDEEFLPFIAASHDLHATPELNRSAIAWRIHDAAEGTYTAEQRAAAAAHLRSKGLTVEAA